MEMSPERIEMLFKEFEVVREHMADAQRFRGKIEGSVRVIHYFLVLGTACSVALCSATYNASLTLNQLKDKMQDLNPVKLEIMCNDVTELKARVGNLESHEDARSVQQAKRKAI